MSRSSSKRLVSLSLASGYIPMSDRIVVCSIIGTDSNGVAFLQSCHQTRASSYSPSWSTIIRPPFTHASTREGSKLTTFVQATSALDACSISGYLPSGESRQAIIHQAFECSGSILTVFLADAKASSKLPFSSDSIASK